MMKHATLQSPYKGPIERVANEDTQPSTAGANYLGGTQHDQAAISPKTFSPHLLASEFGFRVLSDRITRTLLVHNW